MKLISIFFKRKDSFSLVITCVITFMFTQQELLAQTIVEKHGLLQVQGNKIVDKNNDPVSLAGNSLFWSNAGDVADFYNSTTVNHLADEWNSSIVRAAMGVKESWDQGTGYVDDPETQEAKIRKVIDAAIAKGIYVIIDWHSHEAETYQEEAVAFFGKMADIYGAHPNVIYEVYNEPINQSWSDIKSYAEAVSAAIRAEDPDNLIVVGTPFYSQRVDQASESPISDVNTAYTLHFYAGTHGDWLRGVATTALNNDIALFVTEWGTVNADGNGGVAIESTNTWLAFLKSHNISHVNWTVGDKNESSCVVQSNSGVDGLLNDELTESGLFVKDMIQNWTNNTSLGIVTSKDATIAIPNPIRDNNITLKNMPEAINQLAIYDVKGVNVLSKRIVGNKTNIVLDTYQLEQGIYILKMVTAKGNILERKLVKQ